MSRKKNNRKRKIHNKKPITPYEYYKPVWHYINENHYNEIYNGGIVRPKEFRRKILLGLKDNFNTSTIDIKYKILNEVLIKIESEFDHVLSNHSVFYWLHIYRRIAPCLATELGNNTDEETVIVVRSHLEQAIYKYGELYKTDDYALSSDIEFNDILGGMLYNLMKKNSSQSQIDLYIEKIKESKQWVLTSFSVQSLVDIYYMEGIAYQYWYVLAKMRAIGKKINAMIDDSGLINEIRTDEQDFLITSFDRRNSENSPSFGLTSNVGTFVSSEVGNVNNTIFCAMINSLRYELSSFGIRGLSSKFSPNFIPFFINSDSFYDAHKYLEK